MHYFLISETPVFPGAETIVEEQSRPVGENIPFCLIASTASVLLFFPTLEWLRTLVFNAFPEEESLNEVGGSETKIEVKTFLMEKNLRQSCGSSCVF